VVYLNYGENGTSNPVLVNCVLSGNNATSFGGGILNSSGNPTMINCITWNNSTAFEGTGSVSISYSISQSGAIYMDGGNNKPDGTDPLFLFAPLFNAAPTSAGDFHVMTGSPAIDMGNNANNTYPTDLDGVPRIMGGIIDIGPYEKLLNCDTDTLFVAADGTVSCLPVDSLLLDTIPDGCTLLVDGVPYSDDDCVSFSCEDIFDSNHELLLVCGCDTIDFCTKIVRVLDTFPKHLIAIDQLNVSLDVMCMKYLHLMMYWLISSVASMDMKYTLSILRAPIIMIRTTNWILAM
jgi:hypothetical protein